MARLLFMHRQNAIHSVAMSISAYLLLWDTHAASPGLLHSMRREEKGKLFSNRVHVLQQKLDKYVHAPTRTSHRVRTIQAHNSKI